MIIALLVAISILWIFGGQRLSLFLDRFGTIEIASAPIESISYEGSGTGGIVLINQLRLSLTTSPAARSVTVPTVSHGAPWRPSLIRP